MSSRNAKIALGAWFAGTCCMIADYPTWPIDNIFGIIPNYEASMNSYVTEGNYPYTEDRSTVSLHRMAFNAGARAAAFGFIQLQDHVNNDLSPNF